MRHGGADTDEAPKAQRSGAQRFLRVYAVLLIVLGVLFLVVAGFIAAAVANPAVAEGFSAALAGSGASLADLGFSEGLESALAAAFLARAVVLIITGFLGELTASDKRHAVAFLVCAALGLVLSAFSAGYAAFAGSIAQDVVVYAVDVAISIVTVFCGVLVDGQR